MEAAQPPRWGQDCWESVTLLLRKSSYPAPTCCNKCQATQGGLTWVLWFRVPNEVPAKEGAVSVIGHVSADASRGVGPQPVNHPQLSVFPNEAPDVPSPLCCRNFQPTDFVSIIKCVKLLRWDDL